MELWEQGSVVYLMPSMHRCWSQSTSLSITIYNFKDCWGRRYQAHSMKILYAQWFKSTGNRMEQDCILEKVWSGIPCPPQYRLKRLCGIQGTRELVCQTWHKSAEAMRSWMSGYGIRYQGNSQHCPQICAKIASSGWQLCAKLTSPRRDKSVTLTSRAMLLGEQMWSKHRAT